MSQACVSLCPDSIGTKLGGKPGGKKPFKPYNKNTDKKSKPGKGGDGGKKQHKFGFSKAGKGPQKRKLPPFKAKKEEEEGEGEKTPARLECSLHISLLTFFSLLLKFLLLSLSLLDSLLEFNKCSILHESEHH